METFDRGIKFVSVPSSATTWHLLPEGEGFHLNVTMLTLVHLNVTMLTLVRLNVTMLTLICMNVTMRTLRCLRRKHAEI